MDQKRERHSERDGGEREGCVCVGGEEGDGELVSKQNDAGGKAEGGWREWGRHKERWKDMISSWKQL